MQSKSMVHVNALLWEAERCHMLLTQRCQVIFLFVFPFWEATFLDIIPEDDMIIWVSSDSMPLCVSLKDIQKERRMFCWLLWSHHLHCYWAHLLDKLSAKCLKYLNSRWPFPPCVSAAVWTAVMWAMTVMRPMLAAYPASLIDHHLSPGVMASPALDFKRVTHRPPRGEDTRAVRLAPSTRPIRCQPAAPAASAAHLALSSSKGWTWTIPTSSLVTWVTVTF